MGKTFTYNFLDFTSNEIKSLIKNNINDADTVKLIREKIIENVKKQLNDKFKEKQNILKSIESIKNDGSVYSLDKICNYIPFNDNELNDQCNFGDGTDYTFPYGEYQYIIGRLDTLSALDDQLGGQLKKCNRIKVLNLGGDKLNWSIFINDIFIYCSFVHGYTPKDSKNQKINYFRFPIRAIYDNRCSVVEKCSINNNNCKDVDEFKISLDDLKHMNKFCVIGKEHTDQMFDVITFREVIILTKIFGMHVYEWMGPRNKVNDLDIKIYFFSVHDIPQEILNKQLSPEGTVLYKKINVNFKEAVGVQIGADYYKYLYKHNKHEYLESKKKYLELKNDLL